MDGTESNLSGSSKGLGTSSEPALGEGGGKSPSQDGPRHAGRVRISLCPRKKSGRGGTAPGRTLAVQPRSTSWCFASAGPTDLAPSPYLQAAFDCPRRAVVLCRITVRFVHPSFPHREKEVVQEAPKGTRRNKHPRVPESDYPRGPWQAAALSSEHNALPSAASLGLARLFLPVTALRRQQYPPLGSFFQPPSPTSAPANPSDTTAASSRAVASFGPVSGKDSSQPRKALKRLTPRRERLQIAFAGVNAAFRFPVPLSALLALGVPQRLSAGERQNE